MNIELEISCFVALKPQYLNIHKECGYKTLIALEPLS